MYFCFIKLTKCLTLAVSNKGEGTGGGYLGVMGAGGLLKAGEEGAGGGIPKRLGSREKWGGAGGAGGLRDAGEEGAGDGISKRGGSREKFRNIGTIFRNRKSTRRRELLRKGAGTGSAGCGKLRSPCAPPTNKSGLKLFKLKKSDIFIRLE